MSVWRRPKRSPPRESSAEVIDLLTLAPLDETTILGSVQRTHRLVVVDEDTPTASIARDIAARIGDRGVRLARRPDQDRDRP